MLMTGLDMPTALHTVLLVLMVVLLLRIRHNRFEDGRRRWQDDRLRLRAGLLAELQALRGVLRLDGRVIQNGRRGLSPRPFFTMYRGNMGKLLLLTEAEVAAVVKAHASAEAFDLALSAGEVRGRPEPGVVTDFELRRLLLLARNHARLAAQALTLASEQEAAVVAPWIRLWRLLVSRRRDRNDGETAPRGAEILALPSPDDRRRRAPG